MKLYTVQAITKESRIFYFEIHSTPENVNAAALKECNERGVSMLNIFWGTWP